MSVPILISYLENSRKRKIEKLEWKIKDLKADLSKWGFADTPSEHNRKVLRIESLKLKLAKLKGE